MDLTFNLPLPRLTPPDANVVRNYFLPVFWGVTDPDRLVNLMREISTLVQPGFHFADNFFTWGRNNSMFEDGAFMAAWSNNIDAKSDEAIVWRRYILATMAFHAVQLDGDFVECGCYRGTGIKIVLDYLGGTEFPREFWGYDLFEHTPGMEHHSMMDHGPGLADEVRRKFAAYPQVRIVQGEIPGVLTDAPGRIAYLHIDLNQATAEIAALNVLFDRVVPGGIVILDDYEWAMAYRRQKLLEDPWFEARGYRVVPLPTGQGMVIKR